MLVPLVSTLSALINNSSVGLMPLSSMSSKSQGGITFDHPHLTKAPLGPYSVVVQVTVTDSPSVFFRAAADQCRSPTVMEGQTSRTVGL
jgi:hypothetical protein